MWEQLCSAFNSSPRVQMLVPPVAVVVVRGDWRGSMLNTSMLSATSQV